MGKVVLISTSVIWDKTANTYHDTAIMALKEVVDKGNHVFLVSGHDKPRWFTADLDFINYYQCGFSPARRTKEFMEKFYQFNKASYKRSDFIVIGGNFDDFLMAVNSQTLLIKCGWSKDLEDRMAPYGIPIKYPKTIPSIINLLADSEPWYFKYETEPFSIYTLTNAGTYLEDNKYAIKLIEQLRACLKEGSQYHKKAFTLHLMSSILATDVFREVDIWSYYPSSESRNDESEVMSSFCEMARYTFKKKTLGPLFIRHMTSIKRHLTGMGRQDPASQIETLHLNPAYKDKIAGKTVVVMDDYLTYGLSFGVANALLRKAGVSKAICVSMGKFGNRASLFDIMIQQGDIFKPITKYILKDVQLIPGVHSDAARYEIVKKFRNLL